MHFGRAVGFASDAAPRGPPEPIRATIDAADPLYTLLRARFQQRPIWSRGALKASLPADPLRSEDKLRFLLPQLGYYFPLSLYLYVSLYLSLFGPSVCI